MIIDTYKRGIVKIQNVYFSDKILNSEVDVVRYYQCKTIRQGGEIFHTNIIDLSLNYNEIQNRFRHTFRNYIKQARKRYNIKAKMVFAPSYSEVRKFCKAFDVIANEKKISGSNEDKLKRMHKNILISYAYIDDVILARHLYIFDASRIRLLHSCLSSEKSSFLKKATDRANPFLHSEDIKYAQEYGFKVFDFGGLSMMKEKMNGVDQFKLGFSGEIEKSYNFLVANTNFGRFILVLYRINEFLKKLLKKKPKG